MNIALDFDDTFTADEPFWKAFIERTEAAGHKVWIVTCRFCTDEMRADLYGIDEDRIPTLMPSAIIERTGLPVWRHKFTGMSAKRFYMEMSGIKIDIWIDDTPECVEHGR